MLLQVADSLKDFDLDPSTQPDDELYDDIIFAAAHQHSVENFTERADPELSDVAELVDRRLGSGWLAGASLRSPQSKFSEPTELRPVRVSNPSGSWAAVDKPEGAFWTSSFLPGLRSAWERLEAGEFSQHDRPLMRFDFALGPDDEVWTIRDVDDYAELVRRHPRRVTRDTVGIDWAALRHDVTAVTLSAAGLARAQNVRVATPYGVAQLSGWDAESTAWLRLPASASLTAMPVRAR
ncbi:hypothetical protein AFB00_16045 [Pseudonocardia sp. HH130630-07]|nr:hypothetical protein AFB00_16045 [Pseudonocardia sp. HH130630-07]